MFHPDGPTLWELAEQALSSTDRGYDLLAPKFDFTPFRTPDAVLEAAAAHTAKAGKPVRKVLDVCCGTGAALRWFRPLATEKAVGIDRSPGMLEEAERRTKDAPGTAPFEWVQGDALSLPFEREFDVVTCFGAFGHILEKDEPRFVAQIAKVLRLGGRFVFVTGELPPITSPALWLARGFNAAIRVRNALYKPEFIMYYLTFLLPRAKRLLEARGFKLEVTRDAFAPPYSRAILVTATLDP
jgi:ubiquinone/menaquinone biosynthesis C-methylase UbiE